MEWIVVRGAREHNLKNIDVRLPRNRLVVITGLSGSGKSSLAFDTIFAEGQRRYVESLSTYARQFFGQIEKPDVDSITGLSPAIAIDQKSGSRNPRSTVGTVTEIYDFLRLLFARTGHPHCPQCNRPLSRQTPQQIVDALLALPDGSRVLILAPVVRGQKGEHQAVFDDLRQRGFVRARVDGEVHELDEPPKLEKYRPHTIEAVVDRLVIRHGPGNASPSGHPDRVRLSDSVEAALKLGAGQMLVQIVGGEELTFSEQYACPVHGPANLGSLEPRDFSFNNPRGACPACGGLGVVQELDPALVIPNRNKSLREGAVAPWAEGSKASRRYYDDLLGSLAEHLGFSLDAPLRTLPPEVIGALLYGTNGETLTLHYHIGGKTREVQAPFEGVIPNLRRRFAEARDDAEREALARYMTPRTCGACGGARLRPEVRAVTVAGQSIAAITRMSVAETLKWTEGLLETIEGRAVVSDPLAAGSASAGETRPVSRPILSEREKLIAAPILREIRNRLAFLCDVGLGYLELDRSAMTLSGGESQRIRLATQVGAGLSGVLYVLDEPSIGLHPRDHDRLLQTLLRLRDLGNSVLVVEHDEATIRAADWIIDIGPGAGEAGGEVVASGPLEEILAEPRSLTGQYLSGKRRIPVPQQRRSGNGKRLEIRGAREHNLQGINVSIPLGTFVVVTGVSGSGKSSLIMDTLYPKAAQVLHGARGRAGAHDAIHGLEHLDKVISIDQSPIGRTPRSNPATYTRVFDPIRALFAATPEARARGYDASRFSFNVKGGRCDACDGEGLIQVEMQFLPDLFVPCEVCGGTRYNRETLDIRYRGKTIAEVLDMTVEEASAFFARVPAINERLQALRDVGLGYLRLGQPATTLSGGEAQRIKLAGELARRATGRTLYILDEPTTGLHFADIERLLGVLQRLVDSGNTVVVIEHNLDMIKSADWVIDLGPEGGSGGGQLVGSGAPEHIAALPGSYTGAYLRACLSVSLRA
ncbi:MAG: excinuclease ABC subunit UvrA [Oscillochloridaceae bacterium]|nr:excinuclease ABC subunit UvrA [Chloroflexaceae bacterium]MDW8391959.1 excinuclease ABC subunit UvrA [Oscillochloridaceae bacterium]